MQDDKLNRIEDKIDKIVDRISSIDSTLAGQAVELKEHIRRTEILEDEVKPIKDHVSMVNGVLKFIGLISALAVIVECIHMFFK